jgi:SAM-dependent methyltransferase
MECYHIKGESLMDIWGETRREQARYDRQARWYDVAVAPVEALVLLGLRKRIWSAIDGSKRILEIGIGTGRNLRHHPASSRTTALDLRIEMLKQAIRKASRDDRQVAARACAGEERLAGKGYGCVEWCDSPRRRARQP